MSEMSCPPLKLSCSGKSTDLVSTSLTLSFFFYEMGIKITILHIFLKAVVKIKYNNMNT